MRTLIRSTLVALLLGAVTAPLMAQDIRAISSGPSRAGFWWGLGLAAAQADAKCDGCPNFDPETFPMLDIRLGATLSPSVLLGLQITGGQKSEAFQTNAGTDVTVGDVNVSAYWYPMSSGNLWLQGGLAGVVWQAKNGSNTIHATSGGLTLGAGYDLRMGGNMSITPSLRGAWGGKGKLVDQDGNSADVNWQTNFLEAGVSIIWH